MSSCHHFDVFKLSIGFPLVWSGPDHLFNLQSYFRSYLSFCLLVLFFLFVFPPSVLHFCLLHLVLKFFLLLFSVIVCIYYSFFVSSFFFKCSLPLYFFTLSQNKITYLFFNISCQFHKITVF